MTLSLGAKCEFFFLSYSLKSRASRSLVVWAAHTLDSFQVFGYRIYKLKRTFIVSGYIRASSYYFIFHLSNNVPHSLSFTAALFNHERERNDEYNEISDFQYLIHATTLILLNWRMLWLVVVDVDIHKFSLSFLLFLHTIIYQSHID